MAVVHQPAGIVVAITGGGRGIGRATAAALVRRGAKVAIGDIDLDAAMSTAQELGPACSGFALDVTDRASVDRFVDRVEAEVGPIGVFVNNAGIMPTVRFLEESDASIERQFAINVFGVMHGMRAVIPRMLARGDGHMINVASTAGKFGVPGVSTYCATKHAVVGLSNSMRAELRDTAVDLSVVMPVIVRTELTDGVADTRGVKALQPEDVAASIVEAIETRRFEVWCPRSVHAMYRATTLLPLRASDLFAKVTKAERAMLDAIDNPERQGYLDRISESPQLPRDTGTGT